MKEEVNETKSTSITYLVDPDRSGYYSDCRMFRIIDQFLNDYYIIKHPIIKNCKLPIDYLDEFDNLLTNRLELNSYSKTEKERLVAAILKIYFLEFQVDDDMWEKDARIIFHARNGIEKKRKR